MRHLSQLSVYDLPKERSKKYVSRWISEIATALFKGGFDKIMDPNSPCDMYC